MKRTIIILAIAVITASAMATGAVFGAFAAKYKPKAGGKIAGAGCALCHTSKKGGALNGYGKDLKAAAGGAQVSAATFAAVEGKDSNGDGVKNGDAIKKDVLP